MSSARGSGGQQAERAHENSRVSCRRIARQTRHNARDDDREVPLCARLAERKMKRRARAIQPRRLLDGGGVFVFTSTAALYTELFGDVSIINLPARIDYGQLAGGQTLLAHRKNGPVRKCAPALMDAQRKGEALGERAGRPSASRGPFIFSREAAPRKPRAERQLLDGRPMQSPRPRVVRRQRHSSRVEREPVCSTRKARDPGRAIRRRRRNRDARTSVDIQLPIEAPRLVFARHMYALEADII